MQVYLSNDAKQNSEHRQTSPIKVRQKGRQRSESSGSISSDRKVNNFQPHSGGSTIAKRCSESKKPKLNKRKTKQKKKETEINRPMKNNEKDFNNNKPSLFFFFLRIISCNVFFVSFYPNLISRSVRGSTGRMDFCFISLWLSCFRISTKTTRKKKMSFVSWWLVDRSVVKRPSEIFAANLEGERETETTRATKRVSRIKNKT